MSNKDVNVKRKKIKYVVLASILLILLGLTATAALLFSGGNTLIFKVNSPSSVVEKIHYVQKTGGNVELTEGDLNALIELSIKSNPSVGGLAIKGLYVRVVAGKITLYAQITYGQWSFLGTTTGELIYKEGQLIYTPTDFKIGKLGVPVNFAMKKLTPYSMTKGIVIKEGALEIPKQLFPFSISNLNVNGDKLILTLEAEPPQQVSTKSEQNEQKPSSTSNVNPKVALLIEAKNELYAVYNAVQTEQEKNLIGLIQTIVGRMIESPEDFYSAETQQVKANYSKLSSDEKSDIKDAILNNMQTSTLRKIKSTFGL